MELSPFSFFSEDITAKMLSYESTPPFVLNACFHVIKLWTSNFEFYARLVKISSNFDENCTREGDKGINSVFQ